MNTCTGHSRTTRNRIVNSNGFSCNCRSYPPLDTLTLQRSDEIVMPLIIFTPYIMSSVTGLHIFGFYTCHFQHLRIIATGNNAPLAVFHYLLGRKTVCIGQSRKLCLKCFPTFLDSSETGNILGIIIHKYQCSSLSCQCKEVFEDIIGHHLDGR